MLCALQEIILLLQDSERKDDIGDMASISAIGHDEMERRKGSDEENASGRRCSTEAPNLAITLASERHIYTPMLGRVSFRRKR